MGKIGSAGGKATAIILRKQALERYYANPKVCLNCGKIIEVGNKRIAEVKVKKFCNQRCSALYNNKKRNAKHIYKYHCLKCGAILKSKKRFCNNCVPKPKDYTKKKRFFRSKTSLYSVFKSMKDRCYCVKREAYKNYGGRGIRICEEWKSDFMNFYNWAIEKGYKKGLTIERINNDGNYEPNNCKWIPKNEQSENRRTTLQITYKNETHTITKWANILGINRDLLYARIKKFGVVDKSFESRDLRIKHL